MTKFFRELQERGLWKLVIVGPDPKKWVYLLLFIGNKEKKPTQTPTSVKLFLY